MKELLPFSFFLIPLQYMQTCNSFPYMLNFWHIKNRNLSDSPSHFDIRSEDDTEKNVELLASVATAFAIYDLPVPGGPKSKIPRHGFLLPKNQKEIEVNYTETKLPYS